MELSLIEVVWVYDEDLQEWVLVAREPAPRGEKNGVVDHWMREEKGEES